MDTLTRMKLTSQRIIRSSRRGRDVRDVFDDCRRALVATPRQRRRLVRFAKFGLPPVVLVLGIAGYFAFRPVPQPDYMNADISQIFNFTFLTSEFNRLPVEERLELISQLINRMNSMSSGESVMLAAFAAGIAGKAREQIEENTARLMIDLWDKYALDYAAVAPEDREAFLDHMMIELTRTMEAMAGRTRDISDSERLAEIQRQARSDQERMRGENAPPPQMMGRMFGYMRDHVGSRATPSQRVRAQQLMVDMTRRANGVPLSGGR